MKKNLKAEMLMGLCMLMLVAAVSRYMEIDQGGIQIQIREETALTGRKIPALYANIPILHMGNKGTF